MHQLFLKKHIRAVAKTIEEKFDSGILAPEATFDLTFIEAGEYPYFCLLHPNMVGTVSVMS